MSYTTDFSWNTSQMAALVIGARTEHDGEYRGLGYCGKHLDNSVEIPGNWSAVVDACSFETVPEPITMVLLGSGLLGIGGVGLLRRRKDGLVE